MIMLFHWFGIAREGFFMDWIIPLITLTAMEVVLGIDNIIFLTILAGRLPSKQRKAARQIGLILALGTRLLLLFSIQWVLSLKGVAFVLPEWTFKLPEAREITWKDLILLAGGAFLIAKSTMEIHHKMEGEEEGKPEVTHVQGGLTYRFLITLAQIALLDIVFSLDSVITAVGMVQDISVIVVAMIFTVLIMLAFAGPVGNFVERHPTLKILALSFLILIGVVLVAEGMGQHLDKGYIYFAMGFSFVVEMLNLRVRKTT